MKKNFLNGLELKVMMLVSVVLLQGCIAPGFSIIPVEDAKSSRPHVIGYAPVVEDASSLDPEIPSGSIIPISRQTIAQLESASEKSIPSEIRSLFGTSAPYTIGAGDVIGIIVYDHPELLPNAGAVISQQVDPTGVSVAPGFIVSSTGQITFPYIGRVTLAGLTEIEAAELVRNKIAPYIRDPQVTVRISSFRSRRAYVEGEVRSPGTQIFTDVPMTLAEAISRAGGITEAGDRSLVTLTRSQRTVRINLPLLRELGADASNIPLINGDVINVRSKDDSKVYVLGEVVRQTSLRMRDGRLSLNDAIAESGGPNLLTSNPGQIFVIRNEDQKNGETIQKVFHLDAKNPIALALADKFNLKPRDVVYIDPVPMVRWNRFVNLILPSASVVNTGSSVVTR